MTQNVLACEHRTRAHSIGRKHTHMALNGWLRREAQTQNDRRTPHKHTHTHTHTHTNAKNTKPSHSNNTAPPHNTHWCPSVAMPGRRRGWPTGARKSRAQPGHVVDTKLGHQRWTLALALTCQQAPQARSKRTMWQHVPSVSLPTISVPSVVTTSPCGSMKTSMGHCSQRNASPSLALSCQAFSGNASHFISPEKSCCVPT